MSDNKNGKDQGEKELHSNDLKDEAEKEVNVETEEIEELTDEEKEELLKKYDTESNTRNVRGITAGIVFVLLVAFSLFQLYTGIFGQYTAYIQRTVHLGLDRKSTRLNSSHVSISYAVFCLQKKARQYDGVC